MIILLAALSLVGQTPAPAIGPGRYCAYERADEVTPPGDVRTIVDVGMTPTPTTRILITWPHTDKVLQIEGAAQTTSDGVLRLSAEDGWGNHSEVSLTPAGDLDLDLAPPLTDRAKMVSYLYGSSHLGDCRPEDRRGNAE